MVPIVFLVENNGNAALETFRFSQFFSYFAHFQRYEKTVKIREFPQPQKRSKSVFHALFFFCALYYLLFLVTKEIWFFDILKSVLLTKSAVNFDESHDKGVIIELWSDGRPFNSKPRLIVWNRKPNLAQFQRAWYQLICLVLYRATCIQFDGKNRL